MDLSSQWYYIRGLLTCCVILDNKSDHIVFNELLLFILEIKYHQILRRNTRRTEVERVFSISSANGAIPPEYHQTGIIGLIDLYSIIKLGLQKHICSLTIGEFAP